MEHLHARARRRQMLRFLSQLDKGPQPEVQSRAFTEWLKDKENFRIYVRHVDDELSREAGFFWVRVAIIMACLASVSWLEGAWDNSRINLRIILVYWLCVALLYLVRPRHLRRFFGSKDTPW